MIEMCDFQPENNIPSELVQTWRQIEKLEQTLTTAICDQVNQQDTKILASERHQLLERLFAELSTDNGKVEVRQRLLQLCLQRNQRLVALGQEQLKLALELVNSARHNKRAIAAYRAQD